MQRTRLRLLDHRGDCPFQFQNQTAVYALVAHNDAFDQATQHLKCRRADRFVAQGAGQFRDLLAVELGQTGVEAQRGRGGGLQLRLQFGLLRFQLFELLQQARRAESVGDGVVEAQQLALGFLQRSCRLLPGRLLGGALSVGCPGEGRDKFGNRFGLHEAVPQKVEHRLFQHRALDRLAGIAGTELAGIRAGEVVPSDGGEGATAAGASELAGEQVRTSALFPELALPDALNCGRGVDLGLSGLHRSPERIADNAQLRYLLNDPVALRVEARDAFSRRGVLHIAQTVPHQAPQIELVVQEPSAADTVPADRRVTPERAARAGDTVLVEAACDGLGRVTSGEFLECAPDDLCLLGNDLALAGDGQTVCTQPTHHGIAIGIATTGFARFDASAQAAPRLGSKVFEEHLVHRALEANVQLVDLAL
ncbi:hypothetical protein AYJ57_15820 [Salipiger sp. CCB-MM3]|nr:hypothetical protein AYJ57_15820 [Salipiger sp. CCB-MM3]